MSSFEEFREFPKIPRLSREIIITEKQPLTLSAFGPYYMYETNEKETTHAGPEASGKNSLAEMGRRE